MTAEDKMSKTVSFLKENMGSIRAGRANPKVLDKVLVEYYGTMSPIVQVANISVPEPRILMITPWDASMVNPICKAIQMSDLGINPNTDGKVIRLIFPELNEERRIELTKQVKKYAEDAKVAIRSIRRDAIDQYKKLKKDSSITEDDEKRANDSMQKMTDKFISNIDAVSSDKEKELLSI
ncbi:MAG: ribosome recycling factor [Clostridiales bacterium]|nr:ribosome recycling factor [Clostridiales bacterium]